MGSSDFVTFRGGFTVAWPVVARILELENRGARFYLADHGRFRVDPVNVLTTSDVRFLQVHCDDARRVVEYVEGLEPQ